MQKTIAYCLCFLSVLLFFSCAQEKPIQKEAPAAAPAPVPPKADFQASLTEGQAPLTIKFISTCSGAVAFWRWDFGDGGSSVIASPQHIYSAEGTYTVSLAVEGPGGGNVERKIDFITVRSDVIDWKSAKNYIGKNKIVEGVVVGTRYATNVRGKPTFFNFNDPYTGYFTCILWDSDRAKFIGKFSSPPEAYFLKKLVRVKGLIEEYPKGSGVPEIILTDPSQINIIEK